MRHLVLIPMEFPPGGGTVPLPKSLHQPSTGPFVPDAIPQSDGSCVPVLVPAGLGEFRKESVVRTSGARGRGDTHDPADVHTARAGLEHVPQCEKIDNLSEARGEKRLVRFRSGQCREFSGRHARRAHE